MIHDPLSLGERSPRDRGRVGLSIVKRYQYAPSLTEDCSYPTTLLGEEHAAGGHIARILFYSGGSTLLSYSIVAYCASLFIYARILC